MSTNQPFAFLISGLLGTRFGDNPARFQEALETLAQFEADEVILKSEHKVLRERLNNAFSAAWGNLIREPFFNSGRFQERSEAEQNLDYALGLGPECHTAAGKLRKAIAAKAAAGPYRDAVIKLLSEIVPLADRTEVLKAKIGKRAPKPSKTSMARDERAEKAMHCQCCTRDILAETGVIAHHGYERPGTGWQTASCYGAKELPFEVSRDALGREIEGVKARIVFQKELIGATEREEQPLSWTYEDKTKEKGPLGIGGTTTVSVTRETFAVEYATYMTNRRYNYSGDHEITFDSLKKERLGKLNRELQALQAYRVRQEARYAGWTQTHKREDGQWVALAA